MPPTIASCTPADGDAMVQENLSAIVELTRSDSENYEKVETSQADFAAGTLANVSAELVPNSLVLAQSWYEWDFVDDFNRADSETVGNGWTEWGTIAKADIFSNKLRFKNDATLAGVKRSAGVNDYLLYAELPSTGATRNGSNMDFRIQDEANYYSIRNNGSYIQCFKVVGGTWTQISTNFSKSLSTANTWYYKLEVVGNTYSFKCWQTGSSEPTSWDKVLTDSTYLTGYWWGVSGASTSQLHYFDNIKGSYQKAYVSSGDRVSGAYPLSAVGKFATARLEYDSNVPANTTLTVSVSKDASNWTALASGDLIELWDDGDDLAAENLYIKEELASTTGSATPALSEVRAIFMPVDPDLVEILVGGVSNTVANGGLSPWQTAAISGGAIVTDTQDVWFATLNPWWRGSLDDVELEIVYNGSTLAAYSFTSASWDNLSKAGGGFSWWYALALGGLLDRCGYLEASYHIGGFADYLTRGEFHYVVTTPPQGAFDGYYYIAHVFAFDTPASGVGGQPCPSDTPASGVVRGWQRRDHPASGIVLGWLRNDHPASAVAGNRVISDSPASGIAGRRTQSDTPGSGVVYEVNANNTIELRVLSVEEAAALAALGISFE